MKTTQSLIDNMSEEDRNNAFIVIFLADIEESPKSRTKKEISRMFDKPIKKGLLLVIEAISDFYPALENIKPKYGDTDSRRTWRSKENVDASFVMCFCKDMSEYYIHLEDDVISSPSFVPKLQAFINGQPKETWLLLDIAVLGSKAKVYHSRDLSNIASYFYLMYDEMPIDWLMDYWREIKSQDRRVQKLIPPASLFQHIGVRSSLKENGLSGKEQREPFFDQFEQKFKGMNPSATVTTSMSSHSGEAQDAYEKGSGFFLGYNSSKGGLSVDEVSNTNCSPTSNGGDRVSLRAARFVNRRYPSRKPRGKYTFQGEKRFVWDFHDFGTTQQGKDRYFSK